MYNYFRNIYLGISSVLTGLSLTFGHLFTKSVTVQYPREKLVIPPGARNLLHNNVDDCIGCDQCVRACPVECIDMEVIKAFDGDELGTTSTDRKKSLWVTEFNIDMAKCCFCGLCTYPCPTECLTMTAEFDYSTYKRDDLYYKFANLDPMQVSELREKEILREKEKADKKAAKAAALAEKAAKAESVEKADNAENKTESAE